MTPPPHTHTKAYLDLTGGPGEASAQTGGPEEASAHTGGP